MAKDTLSDDQKAMVRKIVEWSNTLGIDPHMALATAFNESALRNIPADDKTSTAFGPFQVNRATAETNGIDYEKMKENPDLAIWAGLTNLARHAKNPVFEGDPARILAAHRWGENSPFASTGDPAAIPEGGRDYLRSVGTMFPGEDFPKSVYTEPAPSSREGAGVGAKSANQESLTDTISQLPLPLQAAITGAIGAKAAAAGVAPLYGTYRGGKAAYDAVNAIIDRAKAPGVDTSGAPVRVEPTLGGTPSKGGPTGWLAGRTTELTAVPENMTREVATLKGQGPGSASYVEAQNAANIQRQIAAGEPLGAWKPTPGGQILITQPAGGGSSRTFTAPSPQAQARGETQLTPKIGGNPPVPRVPVPVAPVVPPVAVPSSFRKAVEYAKAVAQNPVARAGMFGGSVGAALPYAAADWMKGDHEGAMKKLGLGVGVGTAAAFSPTARKVLPPLAAVAQGYDVSQRAQAKDYAGAGLSTAGTAGALAMMTPKLVPRPIAATMAVGAPLANLARDLVRENPEKAQQLIDLGVFDAIPGQP